MYKIMVIIKIEKIMVTLSGYQKHNPQNEIKRRKK